MSGIKTNKIKTWKSGELFKTFLITLAEIPSSQSYFPIAQLSKKVERETNKPVANSSAVNAIKRMKSEGLISQERPGIYCRNLDMILPIVIEESQKKPSVKVPKTDIGKMKPAEVGFFIIEAVKSLMEKPNIELDEQVRQNRSMLERIQVLTKEIEELKRINKNKELHIKKCEAELEKYVGELDMESLKEAYERRRE